MKLAVIYVLRDFFDGPVQVADVRTGRHDDFAVGGHFQAQHAVRGRMVRPH